MPLMLSTLLSIPAYLDSVPYTKAAFIPSDQPSCLILQATKVTVLAHHQLDYNHSLSVTSVLVLRAPDLESRVSSGPALTCVSL